jgi:glycosyltransferase involved in cell wall biosynthesis
MVTTFYPPYHHGGDGVMVYRLAHALAARGHEVDVLHSVDAYRLQHPGEPEVAFAEHARVRRFPLESRVPALAALSAHQLGGPAAYARAVAAVLDGRPHDVIHFNNVSLVGGPGVLRHGRGVKLYTPHEYWLVCPTHVLFRLDREACTTKTCLRCTLHYRRPPQLWRWTGHVRRCAAHVDCFLMPSRFVLERHRAEGFMGRMEILHNFVPVPDAVPAVTPERPYFLYVGRLERLKGALDLPALFGAVPGTELVIAGRGTALQELQRQAAGRPDVRFLGQVHPGGMSELYAGALAVVVPSLCYETFQLVVAEAMAHGTPVVARRIGAVAELVEEAGGGLLFDTLGECRQAMARLASDGALRSELGARGRAHARARLTESAHVARYLEIVTELVRARGAASGDAARA